MKTHELLRNIQQQLKAPKGQFNSFGKYYYRSCEDILEALKPLLSDASIIISDDIVQIGDRYYVKAKVTLIVDGDVPIETTAFAREDLDKKGQDASQITGSASSYARKYALNGLFLIDDNKDADATNKHDKENSHKPEVKPEKSSMSKKDAEWLSDCQRAKKHLGEEKYYAVLGLHGFAHHNEVYEAVRDSVLQDMRIEYTKIKEEKDGRGKEK